MLVVLFNILTNYIKYSNYTMFQKSDNIFIL